jgi:putative DNA primase/helicase
VVGEGIETTLSGMQYYNVAEGYACISAHGMETVILPPRVSTVFILSDNDRSFTGQRAAFTLARHADSKGKRVIVSMSTAKGDDFNDVVANHGQQIMEFDNDTKG